MPKQLATLSGETLLDRTVRVARQAGCAPIVVVLGAHEGAIRKACGLQETIAVSNANWSEGMGSSISCGVRVIMELPRLRGAIVMTCDMPGVNVAHLGDLAASGELTASFYAGHRGVPAYFPASLFPRLSRLQGNSGAKNLLQGVPAIDLPQGEFDVDSMQDLEAAQRIFG